MTVGELLAVLLLDGEAQCFNCAALLARQCTELMATHFYAYAEHRGARFEKLGSGSMPASIKEAAISKVWAGEQSTLEDALEMMGYHRQMAGVIFKDGHANRYHSDIFQQKPQLQDHASALMFRNRVEFSSNNYIQACMFGQRRSAMQVEKKDNPQVW